MNRLFCFGLGFTSKALIRQLEPARWQFAGSCRTPASAISAAGAGIDPYVFNGEIPMEDAREALDKTTHLLISIPPDENGDRVLRHHMAHVAVQGQSLKWIGYLSTIGVYGDHGGGWIDEDTPVNPVSARGEARVVAENQWLEFGVKTGLPVHIFRLPGIYGPGRNALQSLKKGKARCIIKQNQVFNRIYVDDLARVLEASMQRPHPGRIYNVVDDEPAPPQDVTAFAARLMGIEPPPPVLLEEADLAPMARSFYEECKRVRNQRIKNELGVTLACPDYRAGIQALYTGSM